MSHTTRLTDYHTNKRPFLLLKICKNKENIKCLIFKKAIFDHHNKNFIYNNLACKIGDLSMLQYAHKNGCTWNTDSGGRLGFGATIRVTKNGHLDCLKFIHQHGCKLDNMLILIAAERGQLECLKYLRQNGCTWNICGTTTLAAKNGHVSVLRYAYENGCPWDINSVLFAIKNQHVDCVLYANEVNIKIAKEGLSYSNKTFNLYSYKRNVRILFRCYVEYDHDDENSDDYYMECGNYIDTFRSCPDRDHNDYQYDVECDDYFAEYR